MSFNVQNTTVVESEDQTNYNNTVSNSFCTLTNANFYVPIDGHGSGIGSDVYVEFDTILPVQNNFVFVSESPYIVSSNTPGNYLINWSFSCLLASGMTPAAIKAIISTQNNNVDNINCFFTPISEINNTNVSFSGIIYLDGLNDGLNFIFRYLPNDSPYMLLTSNIATATLL